jgi:hypothetical protein
LLIRLCPSVDSGAFASRSAAYCAWLETVKQSDQVIARHFGIVRNEHTELSLRVRPNKPLYQGSNLICSRVEREVAAVDNVDFGVRNVLAIAFRLARVKR